MTRKVDIKACIIMTGLCLIWGVQQVAIKGIANYVSPVLQIGIRSGIAAVLILAPLITTSDFKKKIRLYMLSGTVAGCLFGLEFLFIAKGLHYTSASHMAVFLYTAPIFAALGLQIFHPNETLSKPQWVGVVIAFGGVCFSFLSGGTTSDMKSILTGDALGILAGLSWGATTVVIRCSNLNEAPTSYTLFYQLLGASIINFLYALTSRDMILSINIGSGANLIFQILIVCIISYFIWFKALKVYHASQLGVLSFMTPVFSVIAAMLILNEKPNSGFIEGALFILVGVLVVSIAPWLGKNNYRGSKLH